MRKRDLKTGMAEIADLAADMAHLRRSAEIALKRIEGDLIGKKIIRGIGRLHGLYQICDVDIAWDGSISAHGYKLNPTTGKPGNQRWDLGTITFRRLK